jgi:hypothetical protein
MSSSKGVFVMAIAPTSNWIFWGTFSIFFLFFAYVIDNSILISKQSNDFFSPLLLFF